MFCCHQQLVHYSETKGGSSRAEERPLKKKKNSAVMSLAFARDGTHCDVSHKMKYSLKKKNEGSKVPRMAGGGGRKKT